MRGTAILPVAALCLIAGLSTTAAAQRSEPVAPVRCAGCGSTGQRSSSPAYDDSQVQMLSKWKPLSFEGQTLETRLIARVLIVSPLVLEVFDSRIYKFRDSQPLPVPNEPIEAKDCGVWSFDAITASSRDVWRSLEFNDIVTATVIGAQDDRKPDVRLSERRILANLQKHAMPVPAFHSIGVNACNNRSGILAVYRDPYGDQVAIYNDGGIHYTNGLYREFNRERLTPAELSNLLAVFGEVRFNDLPSSLPAAGTLDNSTFILLASRYQHVSIAGNQPRLEPLIRRMEAYAERATSHASFVLRVGRKTPLTVLPWVYSEIPLSDYTRFRSRGLFRRDAADGSLTLEFAPLWQSLPESLLASLPVGNAVSRVKDSDPNRWVYFSLDNRLYRVTRAPGCERNTPPCTASEALGVMEIAPPIFKGDPRSAEAESPWMWPGQVGVKLASVVNTQAISKTEYEANKPIYFMMLSLGTATARIIENGVEYDEVRFCQVEPDDIDTCELR